MSVINSSSANFVEALSDKDELQSYAAKRELFRISLEVDTGKETYEYPFDLSGQFISLKPQICPKNGTVHLIIRDGNNNVILR